MMEAILVPLTHALHIALQPTIFKMAAIALVKAQITDVEAKEDVITMLSESVTHIHIYTHTYIHQGLIDSFGEEGMQLPYTVVHGA